MRLYKRKDSRFWWYKFVYDGVAYQASTKTRSRREAEGIASKARLDVIEGTYDIKRQKETPLFKDAMARFLEYSRQQHAEHPNTTARYEAASKLLIATFGAKKLTAITADDVEKYKAARLTRGARRRGKKGEVKETGEKVAPATVNSDLACMKAMYNYLIALDVVSKNPVSRVKLLPANKGQTRVLSFEEERLYLAACPQPLYDVAVMMRETGMRPDEIFRMKRENVNLVAGYVFNPYGKTKAARRKLTLTTRAADLLTLRLAAVEGDYVFPLDGNPSKPMKNTRYAHNSAMKRSGVDRFRLYDLRHTFATRAVEVSI